jgi:two-component system, response regulator PdtaR
MVSWSVMASTPRILIVGEDSVTTTLISTILQKNGYSILGKLATGEEAITKSAELVPDLVVMDVILSGSLDSIDTAHYIFQIFHVPVVFISGKTEETVLARIKYAEPCGIVFKPFTAIEITTITDVALYNHANRINTLGKLPIGDPRKMMDNAAEAIIILDKRGRILLFNSFAVWFVDLPLRQAFMRPWRDVMMFVSDSSGEEVKDPVTDATRQMAGSIYDGSISIVTTTSKRRKVILAIRPIRDNHDRLIGSFISLKENKKTYR